MLELTRIGCVDSSIHDGLRLRFQRPRRALNGHARMVLHLPHSYIAHRGPSQGRQWSTRFGGLACWRVVIVSVSVKVRFATPDTMSNLRNSTIFAISSPARQPLAPVRTCLERVCPVGSFAMLGRSWHRCFQVPEGWVDGSGEPITRT
jgi:hypothetical protein